MLLHGMLLHGFVIQSDIRITRVSQFTLSVIFYCMVLFVFHGAALYVICYYMVCYVIAWYCYSVWHLNNQGFSAHLEQRLLQGWRALGRLCRDTLGLGLNMISCFQIPSDCDVGFWWLLWLLRDLLMGLVSLLMGYHLKDLHCRFFRSCFRDSTFPYSPMFFPIRS